MGRGKIEIKKIENVNSRQVTFSKRRAGLLKKANELAILCDAEVAVIIFSNTGKLFEFCSSNMKRVLSRYRKCLESASSGKEHELEQKQEPKQVETLKEEIASLKSKQLRLLGKDLGGMSLKELQQLEHLLNEGLLSVKERKEKLLMEQLEQSRLQEQRTILENETLRRQVAELRGFFPLEHAQPAYLEYHPSATKNSIAKYDVVSPDAVSNYVSDNTDSITTLQLRPPSPTHLPKKRKTREREITNSSSSDGQDL